MRWFCCYRNENLLLVVMLKLFFKTYLVGSSALFNADQKKILVDALVKAMLWIRDMDP